MTVILHPKMTAVQILAWCEIHGMIVTVAWRYRSRGDALQAIMYALPEEPAQPQTLTRSA
jgi:hypothetical protein